MRPTRLLSRRDVETVLDPDRCLAAVEEAFRRHGAGEAAPPGVLGIRGADGGFHVKAGVLETGRGAYFAAKVNGNFPGNAARGLPRILGAVVLSDASTGELLAILDSASITELRTAAATAVAAKHLARAGAATATIVGCGVQGRAHLRALARVLPLTRVFAYDTDAERVSSFLEEEKEREEEISLKVKEGRVRSTRPALLAAPSLAAALVESDVVAACTPSKKPYLFEGLVKRGAFIAAVGADAEDKQEIDASLLAAPGSAVVTDVTAQCAAFGDLHHAIREGKMLASSVRAELGEVVAGRRRGRVSDSEVVVFDSTGMALQDVAASAATFEEAERMGLGTLADFAA